MTTDAAQVTPPCPKLLVAMSLYKTNKPEEAKKLLTEAIQNFDWNQKPDQTRREEYWVSQILRKEADALITPPPATKTTTQPHRSQD